MMSSRGLVGEGKWQTEKHDLRGSQSDDVDQGLLTPSFVTEGTGSSDARDQQQQLKNNPRKQTFEDLLPFRIPSSVRIQQTQTARNAISKFAHDEGFSGLDRLEERTARPEFSRTGVGVGYTSWMLRKIMVGVFVGAFALTGLTATATAAPNVVDQYTEQIPTPGGKKPSKNAGKNGGSTKGGGENGNSSSGSVGGGNNSGSGGDSGGYSSGGDSSTAYATGEGAGSQAAAANKTNASGNGNQGAGGSGANGVIGTAGSESGSGSTGLPAEAAQAASASAGSDGMGWAFPAILIASAVVLGGLAIVRVTRRSHTPA